MSFATALVLEGPRRLVQHELPIPNVREDDAVLRVEACGLCGTDHELFTGAIPWDPYGFVPGHECVGIVEEIGPVASRRWGVQCGDRVAVETFQSCRECRRCVAGDYKKCERHGLADMYGFVPVTSPPGLWGGYASHHYLAPDSMVLPIAAATDPVVATLFNPLGGGFKWVVDVGAVRAGEVVAILGPGIRGLASLIAAKEAEAGFVAVTGYGVRDRERLELAQQFGADLVVDVEVDDPLLALQRAGVGLADLVVDVTANAPTALMQGLRLARVGGRLVIVGMRGQGGAPDFEPDLIVTKELRIQGAMGVDVAAYRMALDVLSSDRYPFEDIPRRIATFEDIADVLTVMAGEHAPPPMHAVFTPS